MTVATKTRPKTAEPVYLVRLENGLVIQHTRAELERLWAGVDREAAMLLGSPSKEQRQ